MSENTTEKKSLLEKVLGGIEAVCNKLPPPAILFCVLFVIVGIIGAIFSLTGITLVNPASGEEVMSANLFSTTGLRWFLSSLVSNFTGFAPLGLVITMTLGIGICEEGGLLITLLKTALKNVPAGLVPYLIAFVGTCGNIASDTAMVVIPPLAAIIYLGVGKHPVVGMINAYAGAQAGFSANLSIAGTDSLLQGLTNQAIAGFIPDSTFTVDVTCNWFFMFASTFLCAIVIGAVCTYIVEPRMGKYEGEQTESMEQATPQQSAALRKTGIVALIYIAIIVILFFTGPLATDDGKFIGSPLLNGLIPVLFCFFALCGLVYGYSAGMSAMGGYVLFCFFCGQFQGLFNWTKLGTMLAIAGADFLETIGFTGLPMCVMFILLSAFVNIFLASGSAKWAIFAPIFVPMFMLLGYHPGFTQLCYRLGDSPGNCWTPMSPYIWMVLSVAQVKYMPDLKIGTVIANEIPIAVVLQIAWIIFFIIWALLGIPIGPGVGMALPAGVL